MKRTTSYGTCRSCGKRTSKAGMARHLAACSAEHHVPRGPSGKLFHLRAEGDHDPLHWLDLELAGDSTLWDLDRFLRGIWLECCGHLSAFRIGRLRYLPPAALEDSFALDDDELSMDVSISDALGSGEPRFSYDYDFGSTTRLRLRVVRQREGTAERHSPVRLLARNDPPTWPCSLCERPAADVCTYCLDDESPFFCAEHGPDHGCGEEAMLPIVNSPRMGICAYTGTDDGDERLAVRAGDPFSDTAETSESGGPEFAL